MLTESENVVTCRVCSKPMRLLGDDDQRNGNERWYCYEDDQLWLSGEHRWEGTLPERENTQPMPERELSQTVKYCKKCGNQLDLEDQFCGVCGGEQKKRKDLAPTPTQTASIIEETSSKNGQRKMVLDKPQSRPIELWYLVPLFFGIIGGLIGYVAVKDDDKGMADNLLIFGIVMTVLIFFVTLAFWHIGP